LHTLREGPIRLDALLEKEHDGIISNAIIHLAYYHVFDNAAHILRLRYCYPRDRGARCTTHVGNLEVFTAFLALEVIAWSYWKTRENVQSMRNQGKKAGGQGTG
jgi:hypothetical protein